MSQEAVKPLVINIRADLKDKLRAIAAARQIPMKAILEEWIISLPDESQEELPKKGKRTVSQRR